MRLKICLAVILLFGPALPVWAQETPENSVAETNKSKETRLFDEFGVFGDCELSARINYLFVELGKTPDSTGYIIVYRGADALPAKRTDAALQRQILRLRREMTFAKLDESKVTIIDGGFRQGDSLWQQVWVVPPGGAAPVPSDTVEPAKNPTDKAFKVEESILDIDEAMFEAETESLDESDETTEESLDESPETAETEAVENAETKETKVEDTDTQNVETDNETFEESGEDDRTSALLAKTLAEDPTATGTVIFYADRKTFDLDKTRAIVEMTMQKWADENALDFNRVRIVYGGFGSQPKIEFWVVPKGAEEPQPTPESRIIKEPAGFIKID